jgi:hypothetical protein
VPLTTSTSNPKSEDVYFSTYLMFNPNSSGSIWVPLRQITWELHDEATHNADNTWTPHNSTVTGTTTESPAATDNESIVFPDWTTTY